MSVVAVDVTTLGIGGPGGAVWSLPHGGDLDANVVVVPAGEGIGRHVNDEVDVLVVGLAGTGTVEVDDAGHRLGADVVLHIPKHASRRITADPGAPLIYLTVHRARTGSSSVAVATPTADPGAEASSAHW